MGILASILLLLCVAVQAAPGHMIFINGHAMISLRAFSRHFDAAVGYDQGRGAITVTRNERTVSLIPYSNTGWIDDRQVTLRNPVQIIDDVTYLPLRFMCHAFELDCTWSADKRQVFIIVNTVNLERLEFDRDDAWGQHQHVIQRTFDFHHYVNFHEPRLHQGNPHPELGGSNHQNHAHAGSKPGQPAHPMPHTPQPPNNGTHNSPLIDNAGHPGHTYPNGNHVQPSNGSHPGGHPGQPAKPAPNNPQLTDRPIHSYQPVQNNPHPTPGGTGANNPHPTPGGTGANNPHPSGNTGQPSHLPATGNSGHQNTPPPANDKGQAKDRSVSDKKSDHGDK